VWGIQGYEPVAATTVQDLVARHGDQLGLLLGRPLTRAVGQCFV
jgi:hypothetical protein